MAGRRDTCGARDYDVAIVGGAFSGAATALLLERASPGLRVLIVERKAAFDRKVGESAIELSSWFLTRGLGLDRHLAHEQLPKYGLRFWFSNDRVRSLADASELGNRYQTRVPSYHIDRAALDEHVLALAVRAGADLVRPAAVAAIDLAEGGRSIIEVEDDSGRFQASARWIIDATGRRAWLARRLGLYSPIHEHPTCSVWARYRRTRDFDGAWLRGRRDGGVGAVCSRGLSTNHLTGPGWWVWVIPLKAGEISVGVVWDTRLFDLPPGGSMASRFEAFLRSDPLCRELVEGAEQAPGDLHALRMLPYRVSRLMGDGWALVGDAAGFIDPFYSPGLDWGSLTACKTAQVVARALRGEEPSAAIAAHNREFTRGFERWLRALYLDKYYYMGDVDLMEIALRLEVALYYFGVVTPAYRSGLPGLAVPFSALVSAPFYGLMSLVNRRLARLGAVRLAAGTWGRRNAGRRVLLGGFKLGAGSLRWVPGALARLALLEARSLPDRIAARRRAASRAMTPVPAPAARRDRSPAALSAPPDG